MTPTKPLLLSLLLLTLAAPATRADDAEPFEWAGAWTTDRGATRVVDGAGRPGHQRTLEWPSTPPILLSGAGNTNNAGHDETRQQQDRCRHPLRDLDDSHDVLLAHTRNSAARLHCTMIIRKSGSGQPYSSQKNFSQFTVLSHHCLCRLTSCRAGGVTS